MAILQAAIELIGAITTIPVAVVVVALLFRKQIGGAIDRLLSIGPKGAGFSAPAYLQDSAASVAEHEDEDELSPSAFALISDEALKSAPYLEAEHRGILASIDKLAEDHPHEDIDNLVALALAQARVQIAWERVYLMIFGSQLKALTEMNAPQFLAKNHLIEIFLEAKQAYPEPLASFDFKRWSDFLIASNLAADDGDNLRITEFGRAFLAWIPTRGYPPVKPGA